MDAQQTQGFGQGQQPQQGNAGLSAFTVNNPTGQMAMSGQQVPAQTTQPQQMPSQQAQQQQTAPVASSENPDVVTAQEEFKNIKAGDTYTDANGQQWEWAAFDFEVVPEDVKDERVDDLEGEDVEGEVEEEGVDEDDALTRGLDIALSVLDPDYKDEDAVVRDEAIDIVMDAVYDVLGEKRPDAVAEDGMYYGGHQLTQKQRGYHADRLEDIAPYLRKKGLVKEDPQGGYWVDSYLQKPRKSAMEKANKSHRRPVAATWAECKAKDKSKCPFHGAAYLTDQLAQVLKANGMPLGKYGVIMDDAKIVGGKKGAVGYRLLFSVPMGTSMDARNKIARDFLVKNPSIVLTQGSRSIENLNDNTVFYVAGSEYLEDDLPVDAPTPEDYAKTHETSKEEEYGARSNASGATSWAKMDEMSIWDALGLLSEQPTNIVELNEDIMRYAQQFPEALPEGMDYETVKKAYERFKKANAKKRGLQAYLTEGMIVDKAEALADAAKKGLEKQGREYYDAAEQIYKMGSDVFNAVQSHFMKELSEIQGYVRDMPSGKALTGAEGGPDEITRYVGTGFKGANAKIPLGKIPEDAAEILRNAGTQYDEEWKLASRGWDYVRQGCEQREPLLVQRGLELMNAHMKTAKGIEKTLGELQDDILGELSDEWKKKNGFRIKDGEKKDEPKAEAMTSESEGAEPAAPAEAPVEEKTTIEETEKKVEEKKPEPESEAEEKVDIKSEENTPAEAQTTKSPSVQLDFESEAQKEQCRDAAKQDKRLKNLNARMQKMFKAYGADSKEFKKAQAEANEALGAFAQKWLSEKTGKPAKVEVSESAETKVEKPAESAEGSKKPNGKMSLKTVMGLPDSWQKYSELQSRMLGNKAGMPQSEQWKEVKSALDKMDAAGWGDVYRAHMEWAGADKKTRGDTPPETPEEVKKWRATKAEKTVKSSEPSVTEASKTKTATPAKPSEPVKATAKAAEKKEPKTEAKAKPAQQNTESKRENAEAPKEGKKAPDTKTTSAVASGAGAERAGAKMVREMEIPDKPTLESATALNKQFASLEKRLRGLTQVYTSKTSGSKDWQAAEQEMKDIKAGLDRIVEKAKGKGYQWTKDTPKYGLEGPSDKRPLDMPTNFRITGIKGEDGKTVNVPYKAPASTEIEQIESSETEESKETPAPKTQEKKPKANVDYEAEFEKYNEKLGNVAKGESIKDKIDIEGYEVVPYRKNGKTYHLLAKTDAAGDVVREKPFWILDSVLGKAGVKEGSEEADTFFETMRKYSSKVKKDRAL